MEISRLRTDNFDSNQKIANLDEPAKHSLPRQIRMSDKLVAMIKPFMLETAQNHRVWGAKSRHIQTNFLRIRNKVARKFGDPNIKKMTLKTFRHWKATMEYHRTKDILYVKELLGHKNIQNTLVYTHLLNFGSDEYVCKVATSLEECTALLEAGFEYITDFEDKKIFRKRK